MRFCLRSAALGLLLLAAPTVRAQDPSTLIIEDQSRVRAKVRETNKPNTAAITPAPTPDPRDILVGIVNIHVLTKADLELRIASRYEDIRSEIVARRSGIVATFDENLQISEPPKEEGDPNLVAEEEEAFRSAVAKEMGEELKAWVDHTILADEARRQGIVVSQGEFRARLDEAEAANRLAKGSIDLFLEEMRLSREDYERGVYDALLIEKLLERYIAMNYPEEALRAAYDANPTMFMEPAKYLIAHYSVALDGTEDKRSIDRLKAKAAAVAKRLAAGEDAEALFSDPDVSEFEMGYGGTPPTWHDLSTNTLRPAVMAEIPKLKVGETSKVLTQLVRRGTETVPLSFHVVKLYEIAPPTGETFESAKPAIRRSLLELARTELIERLYEGRTHRILTNLGGIPPSRIPSREELLRSAATAEPLNLRRPTT